MAATDKKIQPIIIKRVKKGGGHGHHGGAWKIAYADFVTAMMAFFLLMWLLASTSKAELQGIAEHFSSPLQIAFFGGQGAGDSSSVVKGGGEDATRTAGLTRRSDSDARQRAPAPRNQPEAVQRLFEAQAKRVRVRIDEALEKNPRLRDLRSQVRMDMTADGLRIQIVDEMNRPMFDVGSPVVKPYMRELLGSIGRILNEADARIALTGHTDAKPYAGGERGYSNWELSVDRANASRREMVNAGLDERKVMRVVGLAEMVPYRGAEPLDAVNRRIAIVVMNKAAEGRVLGGSELQASDVQEFEKLLQRNGHLSAPAVGEVAPRP
jgi:chemotaxis protein MotB